MTNSNLMMYCVDWDWDVEVIQIGKPNILNATVNSITPDEGFLVLFPSYLDHSVKPNLSSNQRIVISFNVNLIYK